ncbi:hypothetical protein [Thalassobius sp. MITS945101]|uniref:hypothetical protein n=1 Tax=Thalassobius sp. MITS945101 TaxID=3096994 RepID=UPI00399A5DC9
MPVSIDVYQQPNLIYLISTGVITDADSAVVFETYATHPNAQPGQNILNDMSALKESRIDYAKRMRLQSVMEPILSMGGGTRRYVMYAPNERALALAENYITFWQPVPQMELMLAKSEPEALGLLGLDYMTFDALRADAR